MKQIIVIHGGDSFDSYEDYLDSLKNSEVIKESFTVKSDWKTTIEKTLGSDYEVLQPRMPNKSNAKLDEWKIWFERMFEFLNNEVILVGHSLGGMFLIKYLAENTFPQNIVQLHLVAPPHNQTLDVADFFLGETLEKISDQTKNIYFYFSKDDPLVPFSEMDKFKKQIPEAKFEVFENRGHFKQSEFPELIANLKK